MRSRALLDDADAEVRAQAARVLGDAAARCRRPALDPAALGDASPRVRFFAAIALGKLGPARGGRAAPGLLRENARSRPVPPPRGRDGPGRHRRPRHGCCTRPRRSFGRGPDGGAPGLASAGSGPRSPGSSTTPSPNLVREAARAIYDVPIDAGAPRAGRLAVSEHLAGTACSAA